MWAVSIKMRRPFLFLGKHLMRKLLLLLVGLLSISTTLAAQSIDISGPGASKPGRMVIATYRPTIATQQVLLTNRWKVLVDNVAFTDFMTWPDNTKIVFSSPERTATITVVVDSDVVTSITRSAQVTVNGPDTPPVPVPTPVPVPVPTPPAPDIVDPTFLFGKFGLANRTYQIFKADTVLSQHEKYLLASCLVPTYVDVARTQGSKPNPKESVLVTMLRETQDKNRLAVGKLNLGTKTDNIKTKISEMVFSLFGEPPLVLSPDNLSDAWREIAEGMRKVYDK